MRPIQSSRTLIVAGIALALVSQSGLRQVPQPGPGRGGRGQGHSATSERTTARNLIWVDPELRKQAEITDEMIKYGFLFLSLVLVVAGSGSASEICTPANGNTDNRVTEHTLSPQPFTELPPRESERSLPCFEDMISGSRKRFLLVGSTSERSMRNTQRIRTIEITGNTVLDEEIDQIKQAFKGKPLGLETAVRIRNEVTQLYLNQGYITSRAMLSETQAMSADGVVRVQVIEGELTEINIENEETLRLRSSYILSRIELGASPPLNSARLEDQLRLLRADPLIDNIEASLRPSRETGRSVLGVRVTEANRFISKFSSDNFSPPSIGSERFGVALGYRNPTGFGDEIAGSYHRSTSGGANLLDVGYRLPVNASDGALRLRAARYWTEITDSQFEDLDIEGEKDLYEIHFRQPFLRTIRGEFALSLGFTFQDGQTFVFENIGTPFGIGPDESGVSRTSVIKFGQEYVSRGARSAWTVQSQLNFGIDLFDATTNNDPIPDGRFISWLGQGQYAQRLGDKHLLLIQGDLQLTLDSLLPSEQFVIGGAQSVRGYRQNARTGDNGFRLSIEDRITVVSDRAGRPQVQIVPFVDMGAAWNVSDNPNELPSQRFLVGAGSGFQWTPFKGFKLRLDYGFPFIDLNDRGSNLQDDGFYFSVTYET